MQTKSYPYPNLTQEEVSIIESLAEKIKSHFEPQMVAQRQAVEDAKVAAMVAEEELNTNPRATELGNLFFHGPGEARRALRDADPEKYKAMYREWQGLVSVSSEADRRLQSEENDLEDMEENHRWQNDYVMFGAGKTIGLAEGARIALDVILPQLHKANLSVTLPPHLLAMLAAPASFPINQEGGEVEC